MEYLATIHNHVRDGTPGQAFPDIRAREGTCSRELSGQGHLPGMSRPLLRVWHRGEVTPLSPRLNGLGLAAS